MNFEQPQRPSDPDPEDNERKRTTNERGAKNGTSLEAVSFQEFELSSAYPAELVGDTVADSTESSQAYVSSNFNTADNPWLTEPVYGTLSSSPGPEAQGDSLELTVDEEFPLLDQRSTNLHVGDWSSVGFNTTMTTMIPPHTSIGWGSEHQNIFYMNVWDTNCLRALHPTFRSFGILDDNPPIVQEAILSLAACHMSRMLPQRRALTAKDVPGLAYRPDLQHQAASQEYYQSASRKLQVWAASCDPSQLNAVLAAMILFCSLESSMGNFEGFNVHSNGVKALLQMDTPMSGPEHSARLELQNAWRQAVILNWWRRFHFGTPLFASTPFPNTDSTDQLRQLQDMSSPVYRRVDIMTTLCECLSVVSRATTRAWSCASKLEHSQVSDLTSELQHLAFKIISWSESQRARLRLPHESELSQRAEPYHSPPPITFTSHEAAMDAAYYVASKVFYCASQHTIDYATGVEEYGTRQDQVEGWIWTLLRIASAIDWESCIKYNTHTIGISGLLLACAIQSSELDVGMWVEDWLEERRTTGGLEEGSFPVLQILQVLRIVNRERRRGFDVRAVFNTTDDGGGAGKFQSYHSQVIDTVMVYEKSIATGEHIQKEIPV